MQQARSKGCFWHFSDVPARPPYVRYRGHFRRLMLAASIQDFPHRNVHFAGSGFMV